MEVLFLHMLENIFQAASMDLKTHNTPEGIESIYIESIFYLASKNVWKMMIFTFTMKIKLRQLAHRSQTRSLFVHSMEKSLTP